MKLESLVIVNQHVTVNDLSNFAHTAHHARRIVLAGHYLGLLEVGGVTYVVFAYVTYLVIITFNLGSSIT